MVLSGPTMLDQFWSKCGDVWNEQSPHTDDHKTYPPFLHRLKIFSQFFALAYEVSSLNACTFSARAHPFIVADW